VPKVYCNLCVFTGFLNTQSCVAFSYNSLEKVKCKVFAFICSFTAPCNIFKQCLCPRSALFVLRNSTTQRGKFYQTNFHGLHNQGVGKTAQTESRNTEKTFNKTQRNKPDRSNRCIAFRYCKKGDALNPHLFCASMMGRAVWTAAYSYHDT
jgi:hypothetical protein